MQVISSHKASIDAVRFPKLRRAYELWNSKRGCRFAPSLMELGIEGFSPFVGHQVMVVSCQVSPLDFTVSYWGQGNASILGIDLSHRSVKQLMPTSFADLVFCQLVEVSHTRRPCLYLNDLPKRSHSQYQVASLRLPLSTDCRHVDMVLSVDDYGPNARAVQQYFADRVHA